MKISIKNIYKRFGETVALDNVTMEFRNHAFTTLLGPSGCGKTTLLRIIAGLETPDEGELYFDDVCVFSKSKKINGKDQPNPA
jgi:iron(III) transport system ATP-binding protein